ncbi:MAG: sulfatase [Clostridiales bacterium]|nr:sulfatase [Clostridiales bacterium]
MSEKRPNILFLMYDQQRWDCLGYNDSYPVRTPNLDRLSQEGVTFDNAYTPIPVCAPARQVLFSGKRPECMGALWNHHIVFPVHHISAEAPSWTRDLRDSGYATSYVGIWDTDPDNSPLDYGFDTYISRGDINKPCIEKYGNINYTNGYFGETDPVELDYSYTHLAAERVIGEIERLSKGDKPWYVHMDNPQPHLPCRPCPPFDTMYSPSEVPQWGGFADDFENKPYIQKQQVLSWGLENMTWEDWSKTVAYYYGIISQYDDAVGRILNYLDETGLAEDTIVVYTSDHGDMCGSHRMIDKHYIMYEDVCHIPLIVRYGTKLEPHRVKDYVSQCLDLPPTLLELTGMPVKEEYGFHGKSMVSNLQGEESGCDWTVSTYNGQQFGLFCQRMIKQGNIKYVWNLTDTDELYDLEKDPYELCNRIHDSEYANILPKLRKMLLAELVRCKDPICSWAGRQLETGRKY